MANLRTEIKPADSDATKLPKLWIDKGQNAVLVVGGRFEAELTVKGHRGARSQRASPEGIRSSARSDLRQLGDQVIRLSLTGGRPPSASGWPSCIVRAFGPG